MNIFLVEDSVAIRRLLVRRLDSMPGMRVVGEAADQSQALALIHWTRPDTVLLDLSLATGSGLVLVAELRRSGFAGHIAVLTSHDLTAYRSACKAAGADCFYDKASGLESLFDDLGRQAPHEAMVYEDRAKSLLRDGLTGLYNETALYERLDQVARAATRDGVELAVYVLRLEGLTAMPAEQADALARAAGLRLREACGDADIVARRTEDSFSVVLTRMDDPAHAAAYAQRLAVLMREPFHHEGRDHLLSIEFGMALFPTDAVSPRGLLTLAEATAFGAL